MSSDVASNPPNTSAESKSARKKKAKAEVATATILPAKPTPEPSELHDGKSNGVDGTSEHPYIKELQKGIRNVNKKLNLMQKVDSIIAENPGLTLDELVAARKINNDQKAQALKKPVLQAQLTQLEEQITQYKKFDQEYQQKLVSEKETLTTTHSEELEKLRETLKAEAEAEKQKEFKKRFLTLSRFLRAAAARRQIEEQQHTALSMAFEGALLLVYSGDSSAVDAAEKLIDGSQEQVPSTEGELLNITYAEVKDAALLEAPYSAEEQWLDDVAQAQPGPPETDPTVAHAGLTELEDTTILVNGGEVETSNIPPASNIDAGAANAAADSQWDPKPAGSDDPMAESFEIVPRPAAETEAHAPAAGSGVQSWADDHPEPQPPVETSVGTGNDGFREVHHNRGGRGRGGFQGERGGYRGRGGPRGEGRGRGGYRGDRGDGYRGRGRGGGYRGPRGPRGGDHSNNTQ